jgi:hypothetical protein
MYREDAMAHGKYSIASGLLEVVEVGVEDLDKEADVRVVGLARVRDLERALQALEHALGVAEGLLARLVRVRVGVRVGVRVRVRVRVLVRLRLRLRVGVRSRLGLGLGLGSEGRVGRLAPEHI